VKFTKAPLFTFIDDFKKRKKGIPGAGSYFKDTEEVTVMKQLSMSPRELRIYRH
jgi:carbon monoxide dehydrogenase subunit G